jgi:hypothetical protein
MRDRQLANGKTPVQSDSDTMVPPDHALPAAARRMLSRWRDLAEDNGGLAGGLPGLHALAPALIPADLLPWTMTFRRDAARHLSYGVVGEELTFLFHENPRGKPVLYYAAPEIREARYAIIHQALDEGMPVWYLGRVLFEFTSVQVGRLGLPTRTENGEALLLVYLPLTPLPGAAERGARKGENPGDVVWLGRGPE